MCVLYGLLARPSTNNPSAVRVKAFPLLGFIGLAVTFNANLANQPAADANLEAAAQQATADGVFRAAMREAGVSWWRRVLAFHAVRAYQAGKGRGD